MVAPPANRVETSFLLDDAADVNIVSRKFALQHGLLQVKDALLPQVDSFQGQRGFCYGAHLICLRLADSADVARESIGVFYAMDIEGPPVILGRPWRRQQAVIVDSATDQWRYGEASTAIRIREPQSFVKDLKGAVRVYALFLASSTTTPAERAAGPELPKEFAAFADVFASDAQAKPQRPTGAEHAIELEEGKKPPFQPLYNLSNKELEVLREYLATALKNGWIQRSESEAGAPILFVPKKDGTLRLCVDYRGLNAITVKNRCPLPLIGETLDRLARARFFTKLDLKDAYYRIAIRRGDEWKTAFRTRYGHFEYLVMPFGLTNAPATFQAYINRALAGLVDETCVVYLDDILIYSETYKEHVRAVCAVLERLRKFALYANPKKCSFFQDRVDFLGYVVSPEGVSMDPSRVLAVEEWPRPATYHDVQEFLGFANFYRRFIRGYSQIASPLSDLLKGSVNGRKYGPLEWSEGEEQAFRQLKAAFITAPVLQHYDPALRLRVETDASSYALAGILSQLFDSEWHPIAFWSRKIIPAERNYETHDQELLAIVSAFKQWRHYLEGASHTVQVLTDHANLKGFMKVKQLNGRQARWATFLASFDFVIEHQAGKRNPADAPSRRSDYASKDIHLSTLLPTLQRKLTSWEGLDLPNRVADEATVARVRATYISAKQDLQEQLLLAVGGGEAEGAWQAPETPGRIRGLASASHITLARVAAASVRSESPYESPSEQLIDLIRVLQQADKTISDRVAQLTSGDDNNRKEYHVQGGLLHKEGRVVIPKDPAVCSQVLRMHHNDPLAGHFGKDKTTKLVERKYWWPDIKKDVAEYVKYCAVCQRTKAKRHRPYGELTSLPLPERPWQEISMDCITDLPPSKRGDSVYDAILVVVDRYSKMNLYVPTTKTCTAADLAKLFRDEVVRHYGIPNGIVSDRGPLFTSNFWSDFCYETQVKRRLSTAFHPQTDGQTERANQTLEQYLRCYCSKEQDDWAELLPQAEFAVNNSESATLRMSPFFVLYGWNPEINTASLAARGEPSEGRVPAASEAAKRLRDTHEALARRWKDASEQQAKYYNQKHQPKSFKVGDRVLLSARNLRLAVPKKKLAPRFLGPFRVLDAVGSQAYRLSLPSRMKIHNVFHVSLLEPWHGHDIAEPAESMPLADEDGEWEVQEILGSKVVNGKKKFLVKWKGWPEEYDSWEPEENCLNAYDIVTAFEAQRKRKRGRPKGS